MKLKNNILNKKKIEIMKRIFLVLAIGCSFIAPASATFAAEMQKPIAVVNTEQDSAIHYLSEDITRGSSKPGIFAKVHEQCNVSYMES